MRQFLCVLVLGLSSVSGWTACEAAEAADSKPAKTSQPVFLGEPLRHWLEQAARDRTPAETRRTVEALRLAVENDDPSIKVAAADALQQLGPAAKPAVPSLLIQLAHVHPWVRVSSMGALSSVGNEALPALIDAFGRETSSVQSRIASVFGSMGPDAAAAIPILEEAMAKSSGASREQWLGALRQIVPDKYPSKATRRAATFEGATNKDGNADDVAQRDWPQFHGPLRDSISRDQNLLSEWPPEGPRLLWKIEGLGIGYSSVAIVGNRLLTMGDRESAGQARGQYVLAYDLVSGRELWASLIGPPHEDGPRCTPTIDGRFVYALGTEGDLVCLALEDGSLRWRRSLTKDFGGKMMSGWKFSESPLVDGEAVVCTPGGKDAALVALDRQSGKTLWQSAIPDLGTAGLDGAAYASARVADIAGVRQYVQLIGRGVIGVEAQSGRFLWGYNDIANTTANIPSPVVYGNYVFVTTGYNMGSALLKIRRSGSDFVAEEVYVLSGREFQNHHGGVVLVDGYLYGGHGGNRGDMTCVEFGTGKIAWKQRAPTFGSASVIYADGNVVFRYDRGDVYLVEATPQACRIRGHFQPSTDAGPSWSHPVIHNGKLYLRHANLLLCYDLRAN